MRLPDKVKVALKQNCNGLFEWAILLNFFKNHQHSLSKRQKIKIYIKCEQIRTYWNTPRENKKNIKGQERILIEPSLDIQISDIQPDNIYTDTDIQEYIQTRNQTLLQRLLFRTNLVEFSTVDPKSTYVSQ